jgi:hypothetical protein
MTFERGQIGFFIAFIIIGAILGAAIGTFIAEYIPALSAINKSLTGPLGFNLEIISFHINLNLSAVIGSITGIIIFIKI